MSAYAHTPRGGSAPHPEPLADHLDALAAATALNALRAEILAHARSRAGPSVCGSGRTPAQR